MAFAWNILFVQPVGRGGVADMRGRLTPGQRTFMSLAQATRSSWKAVTLDKGIGDPGKSSNPVKVAVAGSESENVSNAVGEDVTTRRAIQRELRARGYTPGLEADGAGMITRAAIMAFEYDNGLAMSGRATSELLKQILFGATAGQSGESQSGSAIVSGPMAREIVVTLQHSLRGLGYKVGKASGKLDAATTAAIRDFEADQNLPETGRVSGRLVARLARLADGGRLALGK